RRRTGSDDPAVLQPGPAPDSRLGPEGIWCFACRPGPSPGTLTGNSRTGLPAFLTGRSPKQRAIRTNNLLHPGYLTAIVPSTNGRRLKMQRGIPVLPAWTLGSP